MIQECFWPTKWVSWVDFPICCKEALSCVLWFWIVHFIQVQFWQVKTNIVINVWVHLLLSMETFGYIFIWFIIVHLTELCICAHQRKKHAIPQFRVFYFSCVSVLFFMGQWFIFHGSVVYFSWVSGLYFRNIVQTRIQMKYFNVWNLTRIISVWIQNVKLSSLPDRLLEAKVKFYSLYIFIQYLSEPKRQRWNFRWKEIIAFCL